MGGRTGGGNSSCSCSSYASFLPSSNSSTFPLPFPSSSKSPPLLYSLLYQKCFIKRQLLCHWADVEPRSCREGRDHVQVTRARAYCTSLQATSLRIVGLSRRLELAESSANSRHFLHRRDSPQPTLRPSTNLHFCLSSSFFPLSLQASSISSLSTTCHFF